MHRCTYCERLLSSARGLASHIAQTPTCKQARQYKLETGDQHVDTGIQDPISGGHSDADDADDRRGSDPNVDGDSIIPEDLTGFASPPPRNVDTISPQDKYIIYTVPGAAQKGPKECTRWDDIRCNERPDFPFHPWISEEEYDLVAWLTLSKLSAAEIDRFLNLKFVSACCVSYALS